MSAREVLPEKSKTKRMLKICKWMQSYLVESNTFDFWERTQTLGKRMQKQWNIFFPPMSVFPSQCPLKGLYDIDQTIIYLNLEKNMVLCHLSWTDNKLMNKQHKTVLSFFSQNEKRDEKAMMKQRVEEKRGKERGGEEGWFAERQNRIG